MSATKEALLFYRDGQVKFTRMAVESKMNLYHEGFVHKNIAIKARSNTRYSNDVEYRDFYLRAVVGQYCIYEECD